MCCLFRPSTFGLRTSLGSSIGPLLQPEHVTRGGQAVAGRGIAVEDRLNRACVEPFPDF